MTDAAPATDPAGAGRGDRWLSVLFWAAIAMAAIVRVAFLADKPFWRDEAWVALLVDDPIRAATDGRAVPLGFLVLTRAAAMLNLGPPEVWYRWIPLVAGLALLPLLASLTQRLGGSRRVAIAVTWLAVGMEPLVYYSRELKSYDIDLLLAALVPLLGTCGFSGAAPRRAARLAFLLCVAATPWMSFGGIFAVCAVFGWGWLVWWPRAEAAVRRDWILCSAAFAASFAAVWMVALGPQANSPKLHAYWSQHLHSDRRYWLPVQFLIAMWRYVSVSAGYMFGAMWPAALAVAVVGAWTWPRPHRAFLAFLYLGTATICAVAAVSDHYLLVHGRHLLFAAPVLLLWSANGLQELVGRAGPRLGAGLVLGIPVALSLWWSAWSIHYRVRPYHTTWSHFFRYDVLQDVDGLIVAAQGLIGADETLVVSRKTAYAFQFYNGGRLKNAMYCERYCPDFRRIVRGWMAPIQGRAWLMITDEETRLFDELLGEVGFGYRESARASGVRLWEIHREAKGSGGRGPRAGSKQAKSPDAKKTKSPVAGRSK